MNDFSRRGFLGLAGAAGVAGLAACAGTGTAPSSGGAGGASNTIEFWSNHPGNSKPVEQQIIKAFEAANSGLKVKLVDAGKNYEEVAQKFNASLAGGQLPDVVVVSDVTWFNFALNKQLSPLDELLTSANIDTSDYVDALYNDYNLDDQHYALPFSRSTPLFYYNKDLWKAAGLEDRGPKTWQELQEWAPKLKAAAGADKSVFEMPDGSNYLDWYFQNMVWDFGGNYSKEWTLATCIVQSTGSLGGITKAAKFSVGTAFLPGDGNCPTGGAGVAIPAGISDERKKNALKFMEFLTNADNTVIFTQATGYMPVRKSALDNQSEKDFLAKNPNAKTAVDQLPKTATGKIQRFRMRVFVPGGGARIGKALDQVAQGADVAQTFAGLNTETQQVIDSQIKAKL